MEKYLVFDWGGTFLKYALMDENADIIEKDKVPSPQPDDSTKEMFMELLDSIISKYIDDIKGIAISMPGMIDKKNGYCITAGWLTYLAGSYLVDELSDKYGVPVSVENDGKCAALAEYWKGSLSDVDNGAVFVLGTAVGGGIIINGRLYTGNHYSAGEYSYMCMKTENTDDFYSYLGYSGGSKALIRYVAEFTGENPEDLDGVKVFERANKGEEAVLKGLKKYTDILAIGLYNINVMLDFDKIAIGGGISKQPLLLEYIQKSIDEFHDQNPNGPKEEYKPKPYVVVAKFYNDANLIGALFNYLTDSTHG